MRKKIVLILISMILIASIYGEKLQVSPVEELNIAAGFGYDIENVVDGNFEYSIPFVIYDFKKKTKGGLGITNGGIISTKDINEENSSLIKSKASSVGETREQRQLGASKPIIIGAEKIAVISEAMAFYGIYNILNILFANANINDRDIFSVCKGKAEDILAFKVKGYASSADYMEGMVRHATSYNFLSGNYTLLNIYREVDSEGENLVLPYLELKDNDIELTGMAIFKGNKMAHVLPMEEGRIMNMLRERKGKGVLSIQEGPDEYINFDSKVKRKVKCNKRDGKYEFNIELSFKGDIMENTLYKELKKENEKKIEELMEKNIEKMCYVFLEKMQNVYKIDCLSLGRFAIAKYGRETGVDWNKEVSNAVIKVGIKVKIDKIGIGQY
jgi:Ger(x)C family germination protein